MTASTLSARLELLHADMLLMAKRFPPGNDRAVMNFVADRARILIGRAAAMEAQNVRLTAENARLHRALDEIVADALEDATLPVPRGPVPVHAVGDE